MYAKIAVKKSEYSMEEIKAQHKKIKKKKIRYTISIYDNVDMELTMLIVRCQHYSVNSLKCHTVASD